MAKYRCNIGKAISMFVRDDRYDYGISPRESHRYVFPVSVTREIGFMKITLILNITFIAAFVTRKFL